MTWYLRMLAISSLDKPLREVPRSLKAALVGAKMVRSVPSSMVSVRPVALIDSRSDSKLAWARATDGLGGMLSTEPTTWMTPPPNLMS
ncbi:hypothetical protein Tdes44962_MAKER06980 [Teratosphaeria destructans]|uniref:Uncharacterized protein n=1 Tax=Teratosphaeria destructans TaxID=418781 RepID=A0A9W7T0E5_9PEZI|nr:hypothetical protein Tdes44962_MAKER06980 [Teratosphaeria destructans]